MTERPLQEALRDFAHSRRNYDPVIAGLLEKAAGRLDDLARTSDEGWNKVAANNQAADVEVAELRARVSTLTASLAEQVLHANRYMVDDDDAEARDFEWTKRAVAVLGYDPRQVAREAQ